MVNVCRHLLYESFPHSAQKFYILSIPLITLFLFSITQEFTDSNSEPFCQILTHQETTAEQQRSYLARCSFSISPGMKFYRALLKKTVMGSFFLAKVTNMNAMSLVTILFTFGLFP